MPAAMPHAPARGTPEDVTYVYSLQDAWARKTCLVSHWTSLYSVVTLSNRYGNLSSSDMASSPLRRSGAGSLVRDHFPSVTQGSTANPFRIWAYIITLREPFQYYADQAPQALLSNHVFTTQSLSLTLQLGNVFLLLAGMAAICCFTNHAEIARRYLIAVAVGDLGHIYSVYVALGPEVFWDLNKWNQMVASNVGVSVFLHLNRLLTVAGLFGKLGSSASVAKKTR
jgi:hypothetical protein